MRLLTTLTLATAITVALAGCQAEAPAAEAAPEPTPQAEAAPVAAATDAPADVAPTAAHDGLMANQPWSRPLAPGASVAAGYMVLMNHSAQAETLVAARAEGVGRVEIHDMAQVDGVMQMRPVESGVALAVDGTASFQPGGMHLMFFDVSRSWVEGDVVPVTLGFASGLEVTIDMAVTASGGGGNHQGGHHHAH